MTVRLRLGVDAMPLSNPPEPSDQVLYLYGQNRLCALGKYLGDGVWDIVHQRFPDIQPTHWVTNRG